MSKNFEIQKKLYLKQFKTFLTCMAYIRQIKMTAD